MIDMPRERDPKAGSVLRGIGKQIAAIVSKNKDRAPDFGPARVPGGITNGVAQLQEMYFDAYKSGDNAGKPYLRAMGVVVEPEFIMVNGRKMKVRGLQTSIMEECFETKGFDNETISLEDHIQTVMNYMQTLTNPDIFKDCEQITDSVLEDMATAILDIEQKDGTKGPYFRFNTRDAGGKKYGPKDPKTGEQKVSKVRVDEYWNGNLGLEDYEPPAKSDVVEKTGTPPEPSRNGTASDVGPADNADLVDDQTTADPDGLPEDVFELIELCEQDNEEAKVKVEEMATEAGMTVEEWESGGWPEVREFFTKLQAPAEPEPPKEPAWKAKDTVFYRSNPKAKAVECAVLTSDAKAKTVTLKNLETSKPIVNPKEPKNNLAIPWAKLTAKE